MMVQNLPASAVIGNFGSALHEFVGHAVRFGRATIRLAKGTNRLSKRPIASITTG